MWYYLSASTNENATVDASPIGRTSDLETPLTTSVPVSKGLEMDDVLRQAEALLRFSGEVENRMAESGLGGVTGVIERYVQLRQALDRLSQRELDWA